MIFLYQGERIVGWLGNGMNRWLTMINQLSTFSIVSLPYKEENPIEAP